MAPVVNQAGQRIPKRVYLTTPYWGRVFEMARGRYHRGQAPFSQSAQDNATQAISLVADAHGTSTSNLYKDTVFCGWNSKFLHYVEENKKSSAFAALACFRHMEQRAAAVAAFGPNQKEWLQ